MLNVVERDALFEEVGGSGGAEGVCSEHRGQAGVLEAALGDVVEVLAGDWVAGEGLGFAFGGAEQGGIRGIAGDAGGFDVIVQGVLKLGADGHIKEVAALVLEAGVPLRAVGEVISNL